MEIPTMQLYLMRHGQADTTTAGGEPELTAAGRATIERQAERFATWLEDEGVGLQAVFHSGKLRAAQTAEIMLTRAAPALTAQAHSGLKPNADPQALLAELPQWHGASLLVSHLPFIPALLRLLLGDAAPVGLDALPAGTLVAVEGNDGHWRLTSLLSP
jgi:phosphohistidine phosphatase